MTSASVTPTQPCAPKSGLRPGARVGGIARTARMRMRLSFLGAAPLHREEPGRLPLDEDDDEDQHHDLREHGPGHAFEELVEHAEAERRDDGASQLADAAHHDDEERVDDVALPEVGPDVADLGERATGETGDAGAEGEGDRVDAR